MNPLKLAPVLLILPVLFSCTQKSTLEIATGKVTTIKLGNVVRIKEINVLTSTDDGTFANMAGTAAEAVTPGIIGMGTSKLASATGSIVDGRVEATKMIRVRVKLKDTNELVEVQQEVTPNFTLKIGQEVVITQGALPATSGRTDGHAPRSFILRRPPRSFYEKCGHAHLRVAPRGMDEMADSSLRRPARAPGRHRTAGMRRTVLQTLRTRHAGAPPSAIRFTLGAALASRHLPGLQNPFIFLPEALAAMGKLPHTFLVP